MKKNEQPIIYLDNAATTPVNPAVKMAMYPYLNSQYGNPGGLYPLGVQAKKAVEHAREVIAEAFCCDPSEVYFTSGGTESNNAIIRMAVDHFKPKKRLFGKTVLPHIITSAIEHPSILETCKALEQMGRCEVTYLPVDEEGYIDTSDVKKAIRPNTVLCSVMTVNNELGTEEPISSVAHICNQHGIVFHTDAVQGYTAYGYYIDSLTNCEIDAISISGHKIGAPKGIGVLIIHKNEITQKLLGDTPWMYGGGQQFGLRSGTENVPGIVAMAKAVELHEADHNEKTEYVAELRGHLDDLLDNMSHDCYTVSYGVENILCLHIPDIHAESLVLDLAQKGVCVSTGSACHTGSPVPSHALTAIGLSEEEAASCIRISLSEYTTKEEIERFVTLLQESIATVSSIYEAVTAEENANEQSDPS